MKQLDSLSVRTGALLLAFLAWLPMADSSHAAAFTAGNLAVYRVGSGIGSLISTGSPVFIDEYTPGGILVQSIAMPTVVSGTNKRLIASGTATSEGLLACSTDGRYLVATGYDAAIPTTGLTGTASTAVNRVIGRIDSNGSVDTSTALSDAATANNARSAVSADGSEFWFAGAAGGIRYAPLGATTSTQLSTGLANNRQVNIFNNQLYSSDSSGTALRLASIGSGLPTTSGQAMTNLPGFATSTGSPYSFYFADLSPAVAGLDTLYVCDDAAGIQKFSFDGSTWTAKGSVGAGADAYRGIAGTVAGSTVTLYITRKGGSAAAGGGEIASLIDSSGYSATLTAVPTLLATAAANTAFRGIAFAPLPPPTIAGAATATPYTTTYGTASTAQTFPISGSGLSTNLTVTAPTGIDVSSDGTTYGSTATFTQSNGTASGSLRIRLGANAAVTGSYNGLNIQLTSSGATPVNITTSAAGNGVSAKGLTITANNVSKQYGVTLSSPVTGSADFTNSGLISPESIGSVTLSYGNGAAAGDAAGSYLGSVNPSAATGGTFNTSNYSIQYVAGDLTVTQPPTISLTGTLTSVDTIYGTVSSTPTGFSVTGGSLTSNLTVTAPAGFEVSSDGAYSNSLNLTQTGGVVSATISVRLAATTGVGSYSGNILVSGGGAVTQSITVPPSAVSALSLAITGVSGISRPYDRTTPASVSGTPNLIGVLAADSGNVTVGGTPTATFISASAGTAKLITVTGYSLAGPAASNYTVTQPTGLTADITPLQLTIQGAAVVSKPFDGDTNAVITGTLVGIIDPDVVTFNGTGTFASLAIGNDIAVTSTSTIGGSAVANYSLTQPTGLVGNITAPHTVDLSRYVRVGRYDLPEPSRTTPPTGSLLCQEASNVTYNWDTDTIFLTGDGGTSVVQVTKTGQLIDSMTLALNPARRAGTEFDDTEALAYTGNGEFVMTEERERTLVKFTYVPNTTLQRAATKTMKLGTTIGNIGLEGVTWDPLTGGFILIKEKQPKGIFQTNIDWNALTATNGSPTTANSTNLFNPDLLNTLDLSDLFALSNLPALTGTPEASHLLVISQESGQILNCDRSGNVYSRLTIVADPGSPLSVPAMTMEGICMDRSGNLYVTNEDGGGDFDHPQLWVYALSTATNLPPTAVTLTSIVSSLPELPRVANDIRVADILVVDDGLGPNALFISGADAASFKIIGTALFLKAGSTLDAATKSSYTVNVNVDDATVGTSPDASTTYHLTIVTGAGATPNLIITEVAPWSSSNSGPALAADWFEVTNYGIATVDLTGWTVDDNSNSYAVSLPIFGASGIGPGESVIFIETGIDSQANLDLKAAAFKTLWFGDNPPANLHFCGYSGSGVGLSTAGDAVNLFDIGGNLQAHVDFGSNTGTAGIFYSFDNAAGLNKATLSNLSVVGVSGAIIAANDANEIGSPGTVGVGATPLVSIVATDASASETGTDPGSFRISRSGSTASTLTANYSIATGTGQATAADYTPALTGSVTFAVGQVYVDITITPVDDMIGEGPETLTLSITDTGSYDVGTSGTATITILDNDASNMAPTAIALTNTVATISEAANTASNIRVADITVTDDGQGTNTFGVTGTDAAFFTVAGNSLYLKAGTTLSNAIKPGYSVTVTVDDITLGSTPVASTNFTLAVATSVAPGSIIISEVAPWSSTAAYSNNIGADWFEVTNIGTSIANITGWKMDDNSHSYASAAPLLGITSIAPGESVIFIETPTTAPGDLATKAEAFRGTWFGANPPAGLQIGAYSGSGVGLSGSSGDEVVLFDASGAIVTGVSFGAAPAAAPFATFDNKAGTGGTTLPLPSIATLSGAGTNGAFKAVNDTGEVGSPGSLNSVAVTVSAGDVTQSSAMLWAHSHATGTVAFEYSTSPSFAAGVTLITSTVTDAALPVKVPITGLTAGTAYYYRATTLTNQASGTFKTPAAAGTLGGLHFGISGDQRGDLAPYPAVKNAAAKDLDYFLLFGDNIYADVASPDVPAPQARTLADYRSKFNEVYAPRYGMNTLAELRAATGVFAVIDDHEVANNFSGGALRTSDSRFSADTGTYINQTETFANGVQAFNEYHPLSDQSYGATGDPITANHAKLYRYSTQGKTAATFVLDTRSFRSAPLPSVTDITNPLEVGGFLAASFTPGRTLLGSQQKADFKADLLAAQAAGIVWKFVCCPEPIQNFGPLGAEDRFEGYAAERTDLLKFIDDNHISNVVFVTADFHGTVINRLSYQTGAFGPQIQTNSIEIITGAIAYDKPFGPTIVDLAIAAGLAAPGTDAYYQSLSAPGKEALVMNNIINPSLAALGYNQIGLATNPLPLCHLISGLYTASNSYGWTEFTIDAATQELNVKTWGIAPYNKAQLDADPAAITGRTPAVVSEFALALKPSFNPATIAGLTAQSHSATINLASASGAYPAGGTFSGAGVTGGLFDPATVAHGVQTITYSYTDRFGSLQSSTFTVTVSPTPLEAWRLANFGTTSNTGDAADTADFDHDGIANLMNYALGLNPTVNAGVAGLPIALSGDPDPLLSDRLALSVVLPSPNPSDVTYTVQASDDLTTWADVASKTGAGDWQWLGGGASHILSSGDGPVTVKIGDLVPADAEHPHRMMRLKVAIP